MPVRVAAERLGREVEVDAAGERVGDDERRRGEVVRLHLGVDARLEVPVAGEHGADDELALVHRLARSGRAAAPSCRCRSCSRSRPCGSRAPRGTASAPPCRSTRSPPWSRARGSTSPTACGRGPRSTAFFASSPAATMTDGLEVFVQLVIAAITTDAVLELEALAAHGDRDGARLRLGAGRAGSGSSSGTGSWPGSVKSGGSLAGNESAIALSSEPLRYGTPKVESDSGRTPSPAVSGTRSCGRRARRGSARRRRGRARRSASTRASRRGRGRGPARGSTPRPARPARRCGR